MVRELPAGTVTFLFTDVEGSTRLLHDLGAEGYAEALAEHRRVIRDAFGRHGGVEVDTQGDAFFVAFPTAPGALAAAAEALQGLADRPIRVRMGIHTGTPYLAEEGYVGADVNRAARIAACGHGGQVLVSASTASLVGVVGLRDLGEHRLKDLSAPERIFQLGDADFPPLKSLHQTNLPVPATPFVGRERELSEVSALLAREDVRLLTLTGPGGTGKTRLALQAAAAAADSFVGGVWWVPLAPLRDPTLVLETAGKALGAKDGLGEHIGDTSMVLLFDNFEHVIEAADAVAELLGRCPNLHVVVTSRELLAVPGEQAYPVLPLEPQEGAELFVSRARAALPSFEPTAAVAELCARLDNLPLALELAAARVRVLSTDQLLERLTRRLDVLKAPRGVAARQQTLRATIAWSYDLLTPEEQRLFAQLAVFAGGWTLEAAEAVCDGDLDLLQSLVDKSLVRHSGERFWMLETIREYALERLDAAGESDDLARRHALHFAEVAEESRRALRGPQLDAWLHRLNADADNLRAALTWAVAARDAFVAFRLVWALEVFWIRSARDEEAARWVHAALQIEAPEQQELRARVLATGGVFSHRLGDDETAAARLDAAIPTLRACGDIEALAFALRGLGWLLAARGHLAEARAAAEEAVDLFRTLGHAVSTRLVGLAMIAVEERDHDEARAWLARALDAAAAEGDAVGAVDALTLLADVAVAEADFDEACRLLREVIRTLPRNTPLSALAAVSARLALVRAKSGDARAAGRLAGVADALHDDEQRDGAVELRLLEREMAAADPLALPDFEAARSIAAALAEAEARALLEAEAAAGASTESKDRPGSAPGVSL